MRVMSREDFDAYISDRKKSGLPLISTRTDSRYLHASRVYYGSWSAALEAHGVPKSASKPDAAIHANTKWTKSSVISAVTDAVMAGKTPKDIAKENGALYSAVGRVCNTTIKRLCAELGLPLHSGREPAHQKQPKRRCRKFYSAADVAAEYKKDREAGVPRSSITYRTSVMRFFGSFDVLDATLGLRAVESISLTPYSKEEIDTRTAAALEALVETQLVTVHALDRIDNNLAHSIRHHYGSLSQYFSGLDIDFCRKPYVPFTWDANNIRRQLLRWIREGEPVNYTSVAQRCSGIIKAARKFYGGWDRLFEACGLRYEDYRVDTGMASFYGRIFEDIVSDVLTELGACYERTPEINGCHPDFVFADGVWADAKLSEWTVHISDCETVAKYEPHCSELNIVFLRGSTKDRRKLTDKTTLININTLIERLPREKRGIFYARNQAILDALDVAAA